MYNISKNIKRYYDSFIGSTNLFNFFTGLYEYIDYILKIPDFKKTITKLIEERNKEYKKLELLEKESIKELEKVKKELLKIIKDKKIKEKEIKGRYSHKNILKDLKDFEKGKRGISKPYSDNLENYLFDIAVSISQLGYNKLVDKFIDPNRINNNIYGNFVFSKSLNKRREYYEYIKREKEVKKWSSLNNLLIFHKSFNKEDITKYLIDNKYKHLERLDSVNILFANEEIKNIIKKKDEEYFDNNLHYLKIKNFKKYAREINNHLLTEISKLESNERTYEDKEDNKYSIKKLPKNLIWEDIELKFLNEYDIEILINNKSFKKTNNVNLGFFKKRSKDKIENKSWKLLLRLSTSKGELNLNSIGGMIKERLMWAKRKQLLSTELKKIFNLEEDPFFEYKEKGSYKTKFKLTPMSELRHSGEIRNTKEIRREFLPKI